MIVVISPAKSLDYESPVPTERFSQPVFIDEAVRLTNSLKKLTPGKLSKLMHISDKLAELNYHRYANWQVPFSPANARQAIFAFTGDVYQGLDVGRLSAADLKFAQEHLRILSGLYGLLRPLDLMQPYRLEMGTGLKTRRGENLYRFWGDRLTQELNGLLEERGGGPLVNLASQEYFAAVQPGSIRAEIISPAFKDWSNGKYRILGFFAKKARGEMAAFIIRNRLADPAGLMDFAVDGYRYSEADSTPQKPVFLRRLRDRP
ncbi:MAG: peroxide stress protein YaaA [Pseudohongiellaceae bacterium]